MEDTKSELRAIYSRHRKNPKLPYDEETFLNFLRQQPRPGNIVESQRELWRRIAFYDDIDITFGICLDRGDYDKRWSLEALATHIDKKRGDAPGQIELVNQRIEEQGPIIREELTIMTILGCMIAVYPTMFLVGLTHNPQCFWLIPAAVVALGGWRIIVTRRQLRIYEQSRDAMFARQRISSVQDPKSGV